MRMQYRVTLTEKEMESVCKPRAKFSLTFRQTGIGLRGDERTRIVHGRDGELLSGEEFEMLKKAVLVNGEGVTARTAVNGRKSLSDDELDKKWGETAVKRELEAITAVVGDNPHHPDSEFWKSLVKIASVIKGSGRRHITPERIRTAVHSYAPPSLKTKGNRETNLDYLFGRAMNQAHPRYRIKSAR